MNLSDSLNFMFKIAARATGEIAGFMVVYTLLLLSCAFLSTTLFGYEMREFHNLASAMTSLMRLSVGILDFDYNLMKTADGFWAPNFIIFFVFICMLIAVNMFISILSEYYDQVKTEQRQWKDDIKIFELQGMNVPSTSVVGNVHRLWSMLRLKFVLQVEVNPPHLPVEFLPTKKVVGPTWGDGYLYKAAKKGAPPLCDGTDGGPICYPNIFDNASNLVRLHYYSEFVPVELEHMRGKTRANIPILGQVSDSRGFHSHCVGLGNSTSPINELIAEYGKLWDQEIWECSTRECGHIYDPTMDGKSMSIEELFEKEELTWRCPKCKMNKPNEEWSDEQKRTTLPHVDMKFTYRRRPATNERGLQQATVTCLKTHADDMHSEVRPQVLSKMRPRFKTIVNPDDPDDMDIDFVNQCQDGPPDCIDLMEDEFGAKIRLELLVHETMAEDVLSNGKLIGRAKDMFALFRVVEISSWEHFSGEPTKLNTAQGMWKKKDDRKLFDIHTGRAKGGSLTNSQMAETFNKTEREVMLRRRFLQRCHRDDSGYPETPKLLRVALRPSFGIAMSMWWRAWWKDPEMKVVSCGYILGQLKKSASLHPAPPPPLSAAALSTASHPLTVLGCTHTLFEPVPILPARQTVSRPLTTCIPTCIPMHLEVASRSPAFCVLGRPSLQALLRPAHRRHEEIHPAQAPAHQGEHRHERPRRDGGMLPAADDGYGRGSGDDEGEPRQLRDAEPEGDAQALRQGGDQENGAGEGGGRGRQDGGGAAERGGEDQALDDVEVRG